MNWLGATEAERQKMSGWSLSDDAEKGADSLVGRKHPLTHDRAHLRRRTQTTEHRPAWEATAAGRVEAWLVFVQGRGRLSGQQRPGHNKAKQAGRWDGL